jgi:hypothetical protein
MDPEEDKDEEMVF